MNKEYIGGYNKQDASFLRQELNIGNNRIPIRNVIDIRAVYQVCKEYFKRYYWDTRGNEFHLVFF